jgi:hypothetical protein
MTQEIEFVSLDEMLDEAMEDDGYVEVASDDYDEDIDDVEVDGLGLWNRTSRRTERMSLDRETLRDLYGESDNELY